jgi:SAM-dependent methyltransferase
MPERSQYDSIAGMYHALWFDWYLPAALPALEKLVFSRVPAGAKMLDVCCGSGHVTKELVKRGYRVTGVDNSAELIELAQQQLPETEFSVQDICALVLPKTYDAALSTFDSLNHLLTLADLQQAFGQIYRALRPGAIFVFDMNLHEAYTQDLKQWAVDIHDNSVGLVRGQYDPAAQRARTELMWFSRSEGDRNCWRQKHSIVEQRCYAREDILAALAAAGFHNIQAFMAIELGVDPDLGYGRLFVSAIR